MAQADPADRGDVVIVEATGEQALPVRDLRLGGALHGDVALVEHRDQLRPAAHVAVEAFHDLGHRRFQGGSEFLECRAGLRVDVEETRTFVRVQTARPVLVVFIRVAFL